MNVKALRDEAKPGRSCTTCTHRAESSPGGPSVCMLYGAVRRIEINRARAGICGVRGAMWKEKP